MTYWIRFRDWYLTRFRGAGRRGKLVLLAAPLLFACCGLSFLSTLISPPDDPTPTAEVAERAATVELAEAEPTDEPPAATDEPTPTDEPTAAPTEEPTAEPSPTPLPTDTPIPTATPPPPTATPVPLSAYPEIAAVNKRGEYVDIRNNTGADVSMAGWVLLSERGPQFCPLDGIGVLAHGQTIRVHTLTGAAGPGGFSCGHDTEMWNNSQSDPAVLLAPGGSEVSRR